MNDRERAYDEKISTADVAARPAGSTGDAADVGARASDDDTRLFPLNELIQLRARWADLQAEFVDEPRRSVEEADGLVASTIKRLAESFAEARSNLESQWARGGDVSTEDLRLALRRYRSFFDRLLAM